MPETPDVMKPFLPLALSVLTSIAILIAGWIGSRWTHKLALRFSRSRQLDEATGRFAARVLQYGVFVVAISASLESVGVKTTSVVAVLASAGLAVGLALQGSLGNFASGVLILFLRPFRLGDVVTVSGQTGAVHDIGLFTTTLFTADNTKVIIANSSITSGVIANLTALGTRRGEIDLSIAIGADVGTVVAYLEQAVKQVPGVLSDPGPSVSLVGFGKGAMDFKIHAWAKSEEFGGVLNRVRRACHDELTKNGVRTSIPFLLLQQAPNEGKISMLGS